MPEISRTIALSNLTSRIRRTFSDNKVLKRRTGSPSYRLTQPSFFGFDQPIDDTEEHALGCDYDQQISGSHIRNRAKRRPNAPQPRDPLLLYTFLKSRNVFFCSSLLIAKARTPQTQFGRQVQIPLQGLFQMFAPVNQLEESLINSATDPNCRPEFYRVLMASDIFVINQPDGSLDIQNGILSKGATISIQPLVRDGVEWLPMFSSKLRLEQSLNSPGSFLQLNAEAFFEMTRGANLLLNPNLEYSKEFPATEVAALLDGTLLSGPVAYQVEQPTQVLLGQPAEYPRQLVDALSRLFAKTPSVKAAYLAHLYNPSRDEPPHNVIGIDSAGNWQEVIATAGAIARDSSPAGKIVEFIQIDANDSSISQYMLTKTKPFYKKSFFSRLFGGS